MKKFELGYILHCIYILYIPIIHLYIESNISIDLMEKPRILYKLCMNNTDINRKGAQPLKSLYIYIKLIN